MGGPGSGRYPPKDDKTRKLEGRRRKKKTVAKPTADIIPFRGKAVRKSHRRRRP